MLHMIYNPIAGKGKAPRYREAIAARLEGLGIGHRFYDTRGRGDAMAIVQDLTGGSHDDELNIISMGGDGTLNEVLNGIRDPSRVRLGIIPCGSGNDFAAVAGIPETPEGALDVILKGGVRYTDFLDCGGVRGINAIGAGIDVDILRRYERMRLLKGSAAYLASLFLALFTFRPGKCREIADGTLLAHSAFISCAGNGQRIGGGIPICPKACIDDGLMDIVIVDDIPRLGIPGALVRLMKGRILELPTTAFRRSDRLRIESDAPMPIQIDGEIHEDLPFDVKVVSGVLRIFRP